MSQPPANHGPAAPAAPGAGNHGQAQAGAYEVLRALEARLAQQEQQLQAQQANFNAAVANAVAAQLGQVRLGERAAAAPMPRSSVRARAPEVFTGVVSPNTPELVDRWLSEMERYLQVTDAEEAKWVSIAATYLDKSAAKWYDARATQEELGNDPTWEKFRSAVITRFRPQLASRTARMRLRSLRQTGSVAEYSEKFQSYLQMIDDMSTADQVHMYMCGLFNHLHVEVDRTNPECLADAITAAVKAELLLSGGRRETDRRPFWSRNSAPRRGYAGGARTASSEASGHAPMDLSALDLEDGVESGWESDGDGALGHRPSPQALAVRSGRAAASGASSESVDRLAAALLCRLEQTRGGARRDHAGPSLSRDEFDRLSRDGKCFNCKQPGHLARNCPKGRGSHAGTGGGNKSQRKSSN